MILFQTTRRSFKSLKKLLLSSFTKKSSLCLLLSGLLCGCANPGEPTGGAKDDQAPKLLYSSVAFKATHFSAEKITLQFDEYLQLKNKETEILCTPEIPSLEIKEKKKKIVLTWKDSLAKNTTYSIAFNKSIADYTEGNVNDSIVLLFSTGAVLDSLTSSGFVKDARNESVKSGISVCLFLTEQKDSIDLKKAAYLTKTLSSGEYHFLGLKSGQYYVYAVDDMDKNGKLDASAESVAFLAQAIAIPDSLTHQLNSYQEKSAETKLKSKILSGTNAVLVFNGKKPVLTKLKPDSIDLKEQKTERSDSVVLWFNKLLNDTLLLSYETEAKKKDTLSLSSFKLFVEQALFPKNAAPLSISPNPKRAYTVVASSYLTSIDPKKCKLFKDSTAQKIDSLLTKGDSLLLYANWVEESTYRLSMDSAAVSGYNGKQNPSLEWNFETKSSEDLGNMLINISDVDALPYVVYLYDEKKNLIRTFKGSRSEKQILEWMEPGNYKLTYFVDENGNGELDPGNYSKNIQPEVMHYPDQSIQLRANWDLETEIRITR